MSSVVATTDTDVVAELTVKFKSSSDRGDPLTLIPLAFALSDRATRTVNT